MGVSVFVGNVAYATTEETLREVFAEVGAVVQVRMAIDGTTGRSRGFAFVEYERAEDAKRSLEQMAGRKVDGRLLRIEMSENQHKGKGGNRRAGPEHGRREEYDRHR